MDVWDGFRSFESSPESHLTSVSTVKNISFHAWSRLAVHRNPICGLFHEGWELFHTPSVTLRDMHRVAGTTKYNSEFFQ
jgi:hypothetical protein